MPPTPIIDTASLDFSRVAFGIEQIRQLNLQRYEMEQLTAILFIDVSRQLIVGYKDVRPDEFWVRGHIPGRPLLPGVLMCEAAAQLGSYYYRYTFPDAGFIGFAGMDEVRFRGVVEPGDRLIVVAKGINLRPRRCVFQTQEFVGTRMVFHADVIGIPI